MKITYIPHLNFVLGFLWIFQLIKQINTNWNLRKRTMSDQNLGTVTVTWRAVTWHLLLRHSLGRAQVLTKCNWVMGNCVYDADWSFSLRNCVWLYRWVKSKCRRKEKILSYCCCCASSLQTEFVKVRCHLFQKLKIELIWEFKEKRFER